MEKWLVSCAKLGFDNFGCSSRLVRQTQTYAGGPREAPWLCIYYSVVELGSGSRGGNLLNMRISSIYSCLPSHLFSVTSIPKPYRNVI